MTICTKTKSKETWLWLSCNIFVTLVRTSLGEYITNYLDFFMHLILILCTLTNKEAEFSTLSSFFIC